MSAASTGVLPSARLIWIPLSGRMGLSHLCPIHNVAERLINPTDPWLLSGILITTVLLYLTLVSRIRDWACVSMSVAGLLVLAVSAAADGLDDSALTWGYPIWPTGPILWAIVASLVVVLKLLGGRQHKEQSHGAFLSYGFFAWTMVTVATSMMLFSVRHGVTATHDEIVVLGILTLGLTQLGFAGVIGEGLVDSMLGRIARTIAIVIGCVTFLFSWIISIFYLLPSSTYVV